MRLYKRKHPPIKQPAQRFPPRIFAATHTFHTPHHSIRYMLREKSKRGSHSVSISLYKYTMIKLVDFVDRGVVTIQLRR